MIAGYARVSSKQQVEEGASLEDQEARIRRAHPDIQMFVESGVSATKSELDRRPAGALLLKAIEDKSVDTIVVTRLDRMFRNTIEALSTIERWDKMGVRVIILDMGGMTVDSKNAMGKLFLTLMAGMAEFERNLLGERTKAGMGHLRSQGRYLGRPRYEDTDQCLVLARRWKKDGDSLTEIAYKLNSHGLKTRREMLWDATRVKSMLQKKRKQCTLSTC